MPWLMPKLHQREEVARDLRSVFNSADRAEAQCRLKTVVEKYRQPAPKLAEWIEANAAEFLSVFQKPEAQRRKLRTTNSLERPNKELKRRTRVVCATLLPK